MNATGAVQNWNFTLYTAYIEDKHWRLKSYSSVTYFKFEAKDSYFHLTETTKVVNKYMYV